MYLTDCYRKRIISALPNEKKEKYILDGEQKLERLLKVLKILLHQLSKHSRGEDQRSRGRLGRHPNTEISHLKFLRDEGLKIINIDELKGLYE